MPLDPVFDGASDEHLLLLGKSVGSDATVERCPCSGSERGRKVLSVTVDASEIDVENVVAVAAGLHTLRVPQVVRAASLETSNWMMCSR